MVTIDDVNKDTRQSHTMHLKNVRNAFHFQLASAVFNGSSILMTHKMAVMDRIHREALSGQMGGFVCVCVCAH